MGNGASAAPVPFVCRKDRSGKPSAVASGPKGKAKPIKRTPGRKCPAKRWTIPVPDKPMTDGNPIFKNDGVLRTKLANGAVLLVKEDHSTPVVSLNLWVEAGSIDENPDER